jgi:azurin
LKPDEIVESLLWPKRQVKPEYSAWILVLDDGRTVQGYKRGEPTADKLEFFEPATGQTLTLDPKSIEDQRQVGTLMPDGLAAAMTPNERRDVVRFLLDLGRTAGLEKAVRPVGPVEFVYDRAPLDRDAWRLWEHPVNRDRVYDFYLKEALNFRKQSPRPHVLPPYPGLDGGKLGHWGNQNETTWASGRWNDVDLGSLLSGVFHGPGLTAPKGVGVRLGESGELATCFNPETLSYDAVWRGGFFKFSSTRHGFMDGIRPSGEMLPRPEAGQPAPGDVQKTGVYHGFYRYGRRVVFAYRLGDVELLDSPWVENGQFTRVVAPADTHPLKAALSGGPPQWPQELPGSGELGAGRPYAIDTINPPAENPWKTMFFFGDHDFLPDGSAVLSTMHGDVWRVTGLDAELKNVRWRRIASGLHQPLGVVVAEGQIYVLGRDQITRLHDLNGDGEADFYECFSNKQFTSPGGHDFICGLARDREGRFYSSSSKQGLIRFSADGQQVDVLATGFRNPDGIGIYPDGAVTVPCSEGDWTPASMVCLVKPTGASGAPPHFGYGGPKDGKPPSPPLVYLARGMDNSSGGQVAVTDDRWGPLAGTMVHLSFGTGSHFLLLRDEVAGESQGAIVPLPGEFRSGAHRGKFNARDGQLYVSGMTGWGTYTPDDGCFQRVRYTGAPVQLPRAFHVHENGVLVTFTAPLDPQKLAKLENHFAQAWNYRYSPGYGSQEFSTTHRGAVGHDVLRITGVHPVSSTSCFVELPDLQPVNQLQLLLDVDAGPPQELFVTVNRLDQPYRDLPGYKPVAKTIAAHPLSVDFAMLGKTQPNPWRGRLQDAKKTLEISAGKNLTFSTRVLKAKPGEAIKLTFINPDVVPHNWVLVKPDSLARVGDLANKLVADPEAFTRHYVPKTDDVICYTDIVSPQDQMSIYFKAPTTPGRYPYLCSFPGHWMVMNGELIVE